MDSLPSDVLFKVLVLVAHEELSEKCISSYLTHSLVCKSWYFVMRKPSIRKPYLFVHNSLAPAITSWIEYQAYFAKNSTNPYYTLSTKDYCKIIDSTPLKTRNSNGKVLDMFKRLKGVVECLPTETVHSAVPVPNIFVSSRTCFEWKASDKVLYRCFVQPTIFRPLKVVKVVYQDVYIMKVKLT
jgi:hypothetical protein